MSLNFRTTVGSDNFFDFNYFPSYSKLERGSFHFLLDYGTILPPTGATFAIAGRKVMRREKNFGRSTIAIRSMLSGYWKRGFAREKPHSQFYPSPFTFSPEPPINTGIVRGEGLAPPFTTLHPPFTLSRSPASIEDRSWP